MCGSTVNICVDRLIKGRHEGGRLAVADKATTLETYEVPGTRGSAVDFYVDRLIEGCCEGGQLAVWQMRPLPQNHMRYV